MVRYALILAGWGCAALAALGLALPLLPATPFALLAAACFARSSPALYAQLMSATPLGPLVRDWQHHRALRTSTKRSLLAVVFAAALLSTSFAQVSGHALLPTFAGAGLATAVILLLPTRATAAHAAAGSTRAL